MSVWRETMEHYYPNSVWLSLRSDTFERLQKYKMRHGIPTFEQALEKILFAEETEIKKSASL